MILSMWLLLIQFPWEHFWYNVSFVHIFPVNLREHTKQTYSGIVYVILINTYDRSTSCVM